MTYVRKTCVKQLDDFTREIFTFIMFESLKFYLDYFALEERKTKRHKWRVTRFYDRLEKRDSTLEYIDVPLTEELINEAKAQFVQKIVYGE